MKVLGWILAIVLGVAVTGFVAIGIASLVNNITIADQYSQWFSKAPEVAESVEAVRHLIRL